MQLHRIYLALVVAIGSMCGFVPNALAWGSCARGPLVGFGEISRCECDSGQKGYATESDLGLLVRDEGGERNGWVAAEYEAIDVWGRRALVPASYAEIACVRTNFQGQYCEEFRLVYRPIKEERDGKIFERVQTPWTWAAAHTFLGRYRSVCLTYHPNFSYVSWSPWMY